MWFARGKYVSSIALAPDERGLAVAARYVTDGESLPTQDCDQDGRMDSDDLREVFDKAFANVSAEVTSDLSYRHLIALADAFEEWALDERRGAEQSAKLLGWSERYRELAEAVGPDWDPPKPEKLSLIAFVGRKLLNE